MTTPRAPSLSGSKHGDDLASGIVLLFVTCCTTREVNRPYCFAPTSPTGLLQAHAAHSAPPCPTLPHPAPPCPTLPHPASFSRTPLAPDPLAFCDVSR